MIKYLIDTNIVISTLQAKEEYKKVVDFMTGLYDDDQVEILYSVIVEAEMFSRELPPTVKDKIELLLSEARIVRVDSAIARKAGELRALAKAQRYSIKLPAAIIAATAIIADAVLVTHNTGDFRWVEEYVGLQVLDPMNG